MHIHTWPTLSMCMAHFWTALAEERQNVGVPWISACMHACMHPACVCVCVSLSVRHIWYCTALIGCAEVTGRWGLLTYAGNAVRWLALSVGQIEAPQWYLCSCTWKIVAWVILIVTCCQCMHASSNDLIIKCLSSQTTSVAATLTKLPKTHVIYA